MKLVEFSCPDGATIYINPLCVVSVELNLHGKVIISTSDRNITPVEGSLVDVARKLEASA